MATRTDELLSGVPVMGKPLYEYPAEELELSVFEAHEMRIAPVAGFDSFVYCVCGWVIHSNTYQDERSTTSLQPERITVAYRQHLES